MSLNEEKLFLKAFPFGEGGFLRSKKTDEVLKT
jgi:hypothetical protein